MNGRPLKKVSSISLQINNQFLFHLSGQKIPHGLHVRLNLQTGLREAKLLDKDEQESSSNTIIPVSSGEQ